MDLKYVLLLITIISPTICQDDAPVCFCDDYDEPVCGEVDGLENTFNNVCQYKCFHDHYSTRGIRVSLKHQGKCEEPPQDVCICPRIYAPVCALVNGERRTYGNRCAYDCDYNNTISQGGNATILYEAGECHETIGEPICLCDRMLDPLCAEINGEQRTLGNRCEYQCFYNHYTSHNGSVSIVSEDSSCEDLE